MDIETISIIIGSIIAVGGVLAGIIKLTSKWAAKKISDIAINEIKKSQSKCDRGREENMALLVERIEKLEKSDNDTKLTIVAIQKDLETLTGMHETTQTMILNLSGQFQDTTSQLIETIKSITIKHD